MEFRRLDVRAGDFPKLFERPAFHIIQSRAEMVATYGDESLADRVDWKRAFVVGVHRGLCRSGGFSVRVREIRRNGNQVFVDLETRDPAPGDLVTLMMTYPSDVVVVPREGVLRAGRVEFIFRDQLGSEVHRREVIAVQPGG